MMQASGVQITGCITLWCHRCFESHTGMLSLDHDGAVLTFVCQRTYVTLRPRRKRGVMMREVKTVGEALPEQMRRVRDDVMPVYQEIGPPGAMALAMMRQDLDAAAKALAEGDAVAMLRAHEALKGYTL